MSDQSSVLGGSCHAKDARTLWVRDRGWNHGVDRVVISNAIVGRPNQMELDDSPPIIPIDIVRMIDDIDARPKERNPDPPPKIEELPPPIPISSNDEVGSVVWSPHRAPKVESPSGPDIGRIWFRWGFSSVS